MNQFSPQRVMMQASLKYLYVRLYCSVPGQALKHNLARMGTYLVYYFPYVCIEAATFTP